MANLNGQGLMELADLISKREYNWGMARARAYEEELVKSYAEENNMEYSTLADTIEALYNRRVIDEKQRENLHNIRIIGNKAVHEGGNDPQDAKNAYYLLKEEIQAFSRRDAYEPQRTPVMIRRPGEEDGDEDDENSTAETGRRSGDETGGIDMSYTSGRRSGETRSRRTSSQRSGNVRKKKKKSQGIDLYTILKFLIPLLIVVLLIILLKSLFHGPKEEAETESAAIETEVATEPAETEPETTEPETTTAPETEAPVTYRISGEGVNIRYADNPGQVYVQFDKGKELGTVEDFTCDNPEYAEGFVRFTYDGKELIVSKRYIEVVE